MAQEDPYETPGGVGVPHIYVKIENLYLTMDSSDIENAIKVRVDTKGGHSAADAIWDAIEDAETQGNYITISEIIHNEGLDRNLVNVNVHRLYAAKKLKRKKIESPLSGRLAWGYAPRRGTEQIAKRQTKKAIADDD